MYRQSSEKETNTTNTKGSIIVLCTGIFLILLFIVSVMYLYIDYTAKYPI